MKNFIKRTLRVIYNFKQITDIYPRITTWTVWKWRMARSIRNATILASFMATGYVSAITYNAFNPHIVHADPKTIINDVSNDMFAQKIDALKDAVVDEVMKCESAGKEGLITYDPRVNETVTSNIPSIGPMQFKIGTVIHYEKLLNNKVVDSKEAIMIALDKDSSRALAKKVFFETVNMAGKDWVNCAARLSTDAKIKMIKSMEK